MRLAIDDLAGRGARRVALRGGYRARDERRPSSPTTARSRMGRGGAWVARASDPLATFYNPAGLAGQDTRMTLQANINSSTRASRARSRRTTRRRTTLVNPAGGNYKYPRVCNDVQPFPNPQLGMTWRVTDRIGIGFMPILGAERRRLRAVARVRRRQGANQPSPQSLPAHQLARPCSSRRRSARAGRSSRACGWARLRVGHRGEGALRDRGARG